MSDKRDRIVAIMDKYGVDAEGAESIAKQEDAITESRRKIARIKKAKDEKKIKLFFKNCSAILTADDQTVERIAKQLQGQFEKSRQAKAESTNSTVTADGVPVQHAEGQPSEA